MNAKIWSALALAMLVPGAAAAHRAWFLPSSTVVSGDDSWVTIDAAASNELFYFDHRPLSVEDVTVTAPDGSAGKTENASKGEYRSTFDVHLQQQGTYRVSSIMGGVIASYKQGGEQKRWRGKVEEISTGIPADATEVEITENYRRIDTFVTAGAPTETAIEPTGKGLEIAFDTHPNDLFAGETAKFRLLMNGKPAEGVTVSVIPGGNRYRDELNEVKIVTGKKGAFEVTWPEPGMYWLSAELTDDKATVKKAKGRRAAYTVTLEVLPQ